MTTTDTAKHSRRVRFTLPETASTNKQNNTVVTSTKSKAVHGTQKYINGTLVTANTSKSSVIVNRNAISASPVLKTYGSDTNVSRNPIEKNVLPKIEDVTRGVKPVKKAYHAVSATVKLQRPRTTSNISRSQSFSGKKNMRQSSVTTKSGNKRYSDSFLYASKAGKGTPVIRIDDTDQRSELELPKFEHALDPHLLNLPMTEDANANYLPHLHESIEANSCLKGRSNNIFFQLKVIKNLLLNRIRSFGVIT